MPAAHPLFCTPAPCNSPPPLLPHTAFCTLASPSPGPGGSSIAKESRMQQRKYLIHPQLGMSSAYCRSHLVAQDLGCTTVPHHDDCIYTIFEYGVMGPQRPTTYRVHSNASGPWFPIFDTATWKWHLVVLPSMACMSANLLIPAPPPASVLAL